MTTVKKIFWPSRMLQSMQVGGILLWLSGFVYLSIVKKNWLIALSWFLLMALWSRRLYRWLFRPSLIILPDAILQFSEFSDSPVEIPAGAKLLAHKFGKTKYQFSTLDNQVARSVVSFNLSHFRKEDRSTLERFFERLFEERELRAEALDQVFFSEE
jgi:hypothetical protein